MSAGLAAALAIGCASAGVTGDRATGPGGEVVDTVAAGSDSTDAGTRTCALSGPDLDWARGLLEIWSVTTREILDLERRALPWIVIFDSACVWHIDPELDTRAALAEADPLATDLAFDGRAVPVYARRHGGRIVLPSGAEIPAGPHAAASVYGRDSTFFALAMADIWEAVIPDDDEIESVERFFLGVAAHELVHTVQLPDVAARVRALAEEARLPEQLNDDVVERDFGGDSAYVALYRRELDLFHQAAREPDRQEKIALTRRALRLAGERRTRYFTGDRSIYAPLEALFLNMEGVAVWTHYRLHQRRPELVEFQAEGNSSWSQDQGFALFLLLDQLVPDWQPRVLGPELASPFALLEEAVGEG